MKATELMIGDWYYWEAEGKMYPYQDNKTYCINQQTNKIMKQEELQEAITRIDTDIANLKKEVDSLQEQRSKLCNQYIAEHALIPADTFAKATWLRNGKKHSGVVFVTANYLYDYEKGCYKVLPTLLKCEPYAEKDDDGTGNHYYTDYWEKQRKFIAYDELLSIEPYNAPRQTCGKCLFLQGDIKDGKLHTYCSINIGRKCEDGMAYACDRFKWWKIEYLSRIRDNMKFEWSHCVGADYNKFSNQ